MNRIKVGLQNYQWNVEHYAWLNYTECIIFNEIDPVQRLVILIKGSNTQLCTPFNVRNWIEFALQRDWYQQQLVFELINKNNFSQVKLFSFSLKEEKLICQQLAKKQNRSVQNLEKSEIVFQFEQLESKLSMEVPTLFKQLYLHLGNGDFGPDYGFFHLFPAASSKITILDAYHDIEAANIKDWDWCLDKKMLPILYWGADIYTLLDCNDPAAGVYVLDLNLKKENNHWSHCFWQHCSTFFEWCQKWEKDDLSGRSLWMEMYKIKGLI